MYYKIVSDGQIIDVCDGLSYVRYQQKNGMWISASEENASGIISSDGSKIYAMGSDTDCVSVAEISEEEYEALRQELIENDVILDDTGGAETPTEESESTETVAKSKTLLLIEQLQAQIEALEAQNEKLMDCLLEMSEVVYA